MSKWKKFVAPVCLVIAGAVGVNTAIFVSGMETLFQLLLPAVGL